MPVKVGLVFSKDIHYIGPTYGNIVSKKKGYYK